MIDVLRPLLRTLEAKWAERPPKVMKQSHRWNNFQMCPRRDWNILIFLFIQLKGNIPQTQVGIKFESWPQSLQHNVLTTKCCVLSVTLCTLQRLAMGVKADASLVVVLLHHITSDQWTRSQYYVSATTTTSHPYLPPTMTSLVS